MSIDVLVTRLMLLHGKPHAAGEVLHLPPAEAADAVASGRARLQNPDDRGAVDAAIRAERDRLLARHARTTWASY